MNKPNINRLVNEALEKAQEKLQNALDRKQQAINDAAQLILNSVKDKDSPVYPLVVNAAKIVRNKMGNGKGLEYGDLRYGLNIVKISGRDEEIKILNLCNYYAHYNVSFNCNFDKDPLREFKFEIYYAHQDIDKWTKEIENIKKLIR